MYFQQKGKENGAVFLEKVDKYFKVDKHKMKCKMFYQYLKGWMNKILTVNNSVGNKIPYKID